MILYGYVPNLIKIFNQYSRSLVVLLGGFEAIWWGMLHILLRKIPPAKKQQHLFPKTHDHSILGVQPFSGYGTLWHFTARFLA